MDMTAILHGFLKIVNKFKTIDFSGGTPIILILLDRLGMSNLRLHRSNTGTRRHKRVAISARPDHLLRTKLGP
jgi:hypothetical protein